MEYSIKDMQENMTVLYNKRTGAVKSIFGGIQTIETLYGDEAEDFKLILESVVKPMNKFICDNFCNNYSSLKINIDTKEIEILTNYPIAAQ
ncbi:hypothetical protein [Rhodopseudomonas parapalustris]